MEPCNNNKRKLTRKHSNIQEFNAMLMPCRVINEPVKEESNKQKTRTYTAFTDSTK